MNSFEEITEIISEINVARLKNTLLEEKSKCEICSNDFLPILQIHHIKPLSKGGLNVENNVMLLCPNCHKTVHTVGCDKIGYRYTNEQVDEMMDNRFTAKQKYKIYLLSLCADLGKELEEVEELVSRFKSERNS